MVLVELEKFTVDNIEMLIDEEVSYCIDFVFSLQSHKSREKLRLFEITESYSTIIIPIELEHYSLNYSKCFVRISLPYFSWKSGVSFKNRRPGCVSIIASISGMKSS